MNTNKLHFLLLLVFTFLFTAFTVSAQDEIVRYELGEVNIRGAQTSDADALKVVAGLKEGKKIVVPDDIQTAMKNLWNLKLFTDIRIVQSKVIGESIFLEVQVLEKPKMSRFNFRGIKSGQEETLTDIVKPFLTPGGIVTEVTKANTINALKKHYTGKGFLDAQIEILEKVDTQIRNAIRLDIIVDRKSKVKIQDITFTGNDQVKSNKLIKQMEETKPKRKIFSGSKYIKNDYKADKQKIIAFYNKIGYRDAKIIRDSVWREQDGDLRIHMDIDEGTKYYFKNITWKGNTLYTDDQLTRVLDIKSGDVYNEELLTQRLSFSMDGNDVSALYMDDGYLFFSANPTETSIVGDSIDVEIRIFEGPQANIDKVEIRGNDRTHEHVIRRELVTKPGKKFSRSDLIRSQRKVIGLGYFDQEKFGMDTPVDQQKGTVDIIYQVEERSSDQLELSAGYQPESVYNRGGLIGTFGLSFNNFSLRNIGNRETWHPLPQGDGQKLSLRAQTSGVYYQSYNFSFNEPWLGGTKPNSFTVAGSLNKQSSYFAANSKFQIAQLSLGLGRQLKWPDENFILSNNLTYQRITLDTFQGVFADPISGLNISTGKFNNLYLTTSLTRTTVYEPIFPKEGSTFSINLQLTPPFSLFDKEKNYDEDNPQSHYKWIEYHKWNVKAEWYKQVLGKFVVKASAKFGFLGKYSDRYGTSPFERFDFGAQPLQNQYTITGLDPVSLRGYESRNFTNNGRVGSAFYNKFTMELRYPFSTNPNSTIFALLFAEGGNAWNNVEDFNPFELKRSVGVGLRVFLPMFGLLGFDYSLGFDKPNLIADPSTKWTDYGKFTILLGFEPE